jgi:NitT/TauT family transport system substrate-binding protein
MYVAEVDPEVVAKSHAEAVPEEWEDPEFGQQYLDNAIRLNVSVTDNLGDLQTEIWEGIQPAMQKFGVIEEIVDTADFLEPAFIEPANDWDRAEVEAEVAAWREENM